MHCRVIFKQAWIYLTVVTILHVVACMVFIFYYPEEVRQWTLLGSMLISYVYTWYSYQKSFFQIIEIRPDGRVFLKKKTSDSQVVTLCKLCFRSKYLMIIQWQQGQRKIIQIISRDMCNAREYHHLFLCLNWILPNAIQ